MTVASGEVAIVVDDYALAALPGLERDLAITGAMIMRSFRGLPNPNLLRRYRGAAVVGAPDRLGLVARLERAAASVAAPVIGVLPAGMKPGPELLGPGVVDIIPAGTPHAAERVMLMSAVPTISGARHGAASAARTGAVRAGPSREEPRAQGEPSASTDCGAPALAVASSTGGVWVLSDLLRALAPRDRLVFVAQHMEAEFVPFLADWLSNVTGWRIAIVESPTPFAAGTVYLAPGGCDLVVEPSRVTSAPAAGRFVPSGDRLLRSAAGALAPRLIGLVLSGMGSDGAQGLVDVTRQGGRALCQAPATAVVPSMPESALRCVPGAEVARAEDLAAAILRM